MLILLARDSLSEERANWLVGQRERAGNARQAAAWQCLLAQPRACRASIFGRSAGFTETQEVSGDVRQRPGRSRLSKARRVTSLGTSAVARLSVESMPEQAPTSSRFWQVWTLVSVLGTAVAGAPLLAPPRTGRAHAASRVSAPASSLTQHRAAAIAPVFAPTGDPLLPRLAAAATASDRCALLEQVQPSEDPQYTYAITAVLERARLSSVRACATRALALQPTSEAQSFLIDLAEAPEPEVQQLALDALATRDDAARAVVIEAAHSEALERRVVAVEALLNAKRAEGFAAAVPVLPLIEDFQTLWPLIDALGASHDAQALPVLQALVDNADRESHLHAITALGELGVPTASVRLEGFLDAGSSAEFNAAAEALRKLTPERLAGKLQALLTSGSGERQELALSAMFSLEPPNLSSIIKAQLESGNIERMSLVLGRLVGKPDPSFEAELTALADRSDAPLRGMTVRALAALGTPSARATVQRIAESLPDGFVARMVEPSEEEREQARTRRIAAVTGAEPVQPNTLIELARDPAPGAQDALVRYLEGHELDAETWASVTEYANTSTVQRLADRGASGGANARRGLIQGLRRRGDPKFVQTLRADLRSDPATRNEALSALADLGDESVFPELQRLASGNDPVDREFAAQLLSSRAGSDATQELERLASDPDPDVMSQALHALQTRSPERVKALAQRAFRDSSPEDRDNVVSMLGDLNASASRPLLELALRDPDDSVAVQAVRSLSYLQGPESARQLLAVINDTSRSATVRAEAASALHMLGGPLAQANRALLDSLTGPEFIGEFVCNHH